MRIRLICISAVLLAGCTGSPELYLASPELATAAGDPFITGSIGEEQLTGEPAIGEARALEAYIRDHGGARMAYSDGSYSVLMADGQYYFQDHTGEAVRDRDRGTYRLEGNRRCVIFVQPKYIRCDTLLSGKTLRNRYGQELSYSLSPGD